MISSESNYRPGQGRGEDDEYGLRFEPDSSRVEQSPGPLDERAEDEPPFEPSAAAEEAEEPPSPRDVPLGRLYLSGTFAFPFGIDVLGQTLSLMGAAVVLTAVFKLALLYGEAQVGWIGGAGVAVGSMLMCALGGILLLIFCVPASAWGLTILNETSYGGETIRGWPSLMAFEGIADSIYLLSAAIMAAVPGAIAASLAGRLGMHGVLPVALGEFFLFPLFLLSMLDNVTPLNPFAPAVWRSVFSHGRAWGTFYLLTLGLAIVVALADVVSRFTGVLGNATLMGVALGAGWVFYFRILGRLAWHCAYREDDETPDDDSTDEEDEEERLSSGNETWTDRGA